MEYLKLHQKKEKEVVYAKKLIALSFIVNVLLRENFALKIVLASNAVILIKKFGLYKMLDF